jgi:hypothetical protein
MTELTPTERTLRARVAAYRSWVATHDRTARTAPARAALLDRFEREVDPDNRLSIEERACRAEAARKRRRSPTRCWRTIRPNDGAARSGTPIGGAGREQIADSVRRARASSAWERRLSAPLQVRFDLRMGP